MLSKLNHQWHRQALTVFFIITLAHLAEHIVQMYQLYILGWTLPESRGILGQFFPWLMQSEFLHYAYALVMLIGIIMLQPGFTDFWGRFWWNTALIIQIWHHFEHAMLISQAIVGTNLWGSPIPTSILQVFFPRAELHFTYNMMVLMPMLLAMYEHSYGASCCSCNSDCEFREWCDHHRSEQ